MRVVAPHYILAFVLATGLGACATRATDTATGQPVAKSSSAPFFGGRNQGRSTGEAGIGVNAFLWRATLDTLSFMPLADSDPFGGTYATEWHSIAEKPEERFKVQVYILDTRLRADGLAVQVFRQTRSGTGWIDATVDPDTAIQIENSILTRARQLRIAQLETR
ncbi:MAG: DUF3576 domain-containing protein [Hyphomonadaceae bacterium]|nr:DUF3576 domain-containing protein [Hyphomonadaceae bacterium]